MIRKNMSHQYLMICYAFLLLILDWNLQLSHSFVVPLPHRKSIMNTSPYDKMNTYREGRNIVTKSSLQMRDASSSYWFSIGDKVKVCESVIKGGIELRGRVGEVIETWEKCDVDPTCCCAEFVDDNYAVNVKFDGPLDLATPAKDEFIKGIETFTHYFHEDELQKVDVIETKSVAFDGMSCTAFKLDQLKMGEQAQRLAAYERSLEKENNSEDQ